MSYTLTDNDRKFIAGMEAAVAERGADYVYPQINTIVTDDMHSNGMCVYRDSRGNPACLIGTALAKAEVHGTYIPEYHESARSASELFAEFEDEDGKGPLSWFIAEAADKAQTEQDNGAAWGDALVAFYDDLKFNGVEL